MQFFLRLKHWQLFIINFGIPLILQFVHIFSVIVNLATHSSHPEAGDILNIFWMFPVVMIIMVGCLFGWMWAVGTNLQKMLPQHLQLKTTMFKIFLLIPVVYIVFFLTLFLNMFRNAMTGPEVQDPVTFAIGFAVIFPVHLFSMFCIFYCIYFVSKTIKTVELQRPVSVSDYIGEFFLVWFFFVGVWILQPKLNKFITGQIPQPLDFLPPQ